MLIKIVNFFTLLLDLFMLSAMKESKLSKRRREKVKTKQVYDT